MKNKASGFTLLEVMLVVALIGIVTSLSYSIFFAGEKSFQVGIDKGLEQADHRILREYLLKELRYINGAYSESDKDKITKNENIEEYTRLEIIKNKDKDFSLLKQESTSGETQTFPVSFKNILIKIKGNKREADIEFTDAKGKVKRFAILLENYKNEDDKETVILSNDNDIIYYTYPQDFKN